MDDRLQELEKIVMDLKERVRVLEEQAHSKIINKNRSSALLREMTKEDAMKVLNGDLKDLDHRDAATQIGLTYAQVYSCRMAYTFKPIHRLLEQSGWSSPWKRRA
jgi:cell division septum initiation protein DivIVA